jgi:hypothetical protein|tara:strand:+ start:189 stop:593 length:405 start_codon:yes stop_codon:yes gene_type:complete
MDWIEAWLLGTNIFFFVFSVYLMLQSSCRFDRCKDEQFTRAYLKQCFGKKQTTQQNRSRKKHKKNTLKNKNAPAIGGKVGDQKSNGDDDDNSEDDDDASITVEEDEGDEGDDHFATSRQVRRLMRRKCTTLEYQ